MTSPDDTYDPRSASAGTTRTPPPRSRRGAPAGRANVDDAAADDLVTPESGAPPTKSARPKGPKPAPGTAKAFDWDSSEEKAGRGSAKSRAATTNRNATMAAMPAADVGGDALEPEVAFEPTPAHRPIKARAPKRPERRFRQSVQKIDLWSVTKIALCFYVSLMGVVVISLVALWVVADSAGIIDNVENFIGDLFSSDDFQFVSGEVLRGAVLVGVVLVALLVAFTIIAASFYNIFAELFGGIEIVIREEEQPPKR